jgi:hypothetical protein
MRHLERHHGSEKEIIEFFKYPKGSKDRRHALALFRNDTNFELYITGTSRPYRSTTKQLLEDPEYYPCAHCKVLLRKDYLKRHAKVCIVAKNSCCDGRSNRKDHVSHSQLCN